MNPFGSDSLCKAGFVVGFFAPASAGLDSMLPRGVPAGLRGDQGTLVGAAIKRCLVACRSCYFPVSGRRYTKVSFIQNSSIPVASLRPHTLPFSSLWSGMGS